jgi:tetratricopeptide (TPR) repeat protein
VAGAEPDPAAVLLRTMAVAESSLAEEEFQTAESQYRAVLLLGWQLLGALATVEGRLPDARDAFRAASVSAVDDRSALQSLGLTHIQMREPGPAVEILTKLAGRNPRDVQTRQLLAQAFVANGQPDQAVQELEESHAAVPDDLELAFALASGYLQLKKVALAERVFAEIVKGRPVPQTHVLVGRAYRDFGEYERARAELQAALKQDPHVRRAHYYLGMVFLTGEGMSRLEDAIAEFRAELKLTPRDPATNLSLGRALVEARREEEALPALELATRSEPPRVLAFYYLGRCLLGLDRPADAVTPLRRALELAPAQGASEAQTAGIHNHLGQALRRTGATDEAASHFAEAGRISAKRTESSREALARRMANLPDPETGAAAVAPLVEDSPLARLDVERRGELRRRVTAEVARAYLNLGVLQARAERFDRAAEHFERAAEVDPEFPQVQYSLGVAYFNTQRFDKAAPPLGRALAANPADAALRRMLATTLLNTEVYDRAAELLRDDPERAKDPSLEFAYGLALMRSGRPVDAERVFSRLGAQHGDSAELLVVLGQSHAQEGDFEAAVESLKRALQLKPDVAEAGGTLGVIYLRQGKLPEAEQALRGELAVRPGDVKSANALATVLDLLGRQDEAVALLRGALKLKPDYSEARYLLGKVLIAQGAVVEATEHLEAAVRLAPEDANIHYQLGRAYQKLGRMEEAQQEYETFRQLKAKSREAPRP